MLTRTSALMSAGEYRRALEAIGERVESGCVWPGLLVKRAICLQLLDEGDTLDEVAQAFEGALELDAECVEALVEYGWFQLNVMDRAEEASALFRRALGLQATLNTEIATGLLKCLQDNAPEASPEEFLGEIEESLIDRDKIQKALSG